MSLGTWFSRAVLLAAALNLAGCALSRMIDSDVQSFVGTAPAQALTSYRFERLPSQTDSRTQDQIESLTQEALDRIGLQRSDTAPGYLVQVTVSIESIANPTYHPRRPRWLAGVGTGLYDDWPASPPMDLEVRWYRHKVHLLMRDSTSNQLAYETTAVFDGPWSDTLNLLPAMLEAALKHYPQAVQQQVTVELPAAQHRDTE